MKSDSKRFSRPNANDIALSSMSTQENALLLSKVFSISIASPSNDAFLLDSTLFSIPFHVQCFIPLHMRYSIPLDMRFSKPLHI